MNLIIGGTGQFGRPLVEQLQTARVDFRVLVRSAASREQLEAQGIPTVQGDYSQPHQLERMFAGVERVFLLTPSSPHQAQLEQALIAAAKAAGVTTIVKLSVFAADSEPTSPFLRWHTDSEAFLKASGLQYTILRPNSIMQNFAHLHHATIVGQHALYATSGESKISFIDASDVAAVALQALTTDQHVGKTYELTGTEAFSYPEVGKKLTHLLRRPIEYVNLSDEAWHAAMRAAGVPEWRADALISLYDFYRQGKGAVVTQDLARLLGRQPTTFDSYLQTHRSAFVRS